MKEKTKKRIKSGFFMLLQLIILVVLLETFGGKGLIGFFLIVAVFSIKRMWFFRDNIIGFIEYLETIMYGKPLNKDNWEPGEFKKRPKRKIKFVWRTKKNENNEK